MIRGARAKALRKNDGLSYNSAVDNRPVLRFARKFLLLAIVTMLVISIIPEVWNRCLNELTASLVVEFLRLIALQPSINGTLISLSGVNVKIITECSGVHLIVLYMSFIIAYPSSTKQKWIGIIVGSILLFVTNIARIAVLIIIGYLNPSIFNASHIYLGQLVMISTLIFFCLLWSRWITGTIQMDGFKGFLIRFLFYSNLFFLLWVPLNKTYINIIDNIIQWGGLMVSYQLEFYRAHDMYYQTFSIITLWGLLMAVSSVAWRNKSRWMFLGFLSITLFQIAYRLCNLWMTAFKIEWIVYVSQIVYNICVFLLPFTISVIFIIRYRLIKQKESLT